jgi:hypothetical protein
MPNGQPSSDTQELASFVLTLYEDLDALVSLREVLFLSGYPDRYTVEAVRAMGDAWSGIDADRSGLVATILTFNNTTALLQAGLTGVELQFKIAVWRRARTVAIAEFEASDDPEARSQVPSPPVGSPGVTAEQPSWPRKLPRRLKQALGRVGAMLGCADTIIGSLLRIMNQFERLKEFKETVEKLSNDMDQGRPEAH